MFMSGAFWAHTSAAQYEQLLDHRILLSLFSSFAVAPRVETIRLGLEGLLEYLRQRTWDPFGWILDDTDKRH